MKKPLEDLKADSERNNKTIDRAFTKSVQKKPETGSIYKHLKLLIMPLRLDKKTPGVYVQEISKFPPSIAQVETAIPAFLGLYRERSSV